MPPQMGMPPLTASPYPSAARGTQVQNSASYPGIPQPTGLAQGLAMGDRQQQQHTSLDHPPGYVQDTYAAEMTSSQRAAAAQVGHGSGGGLSSYHSSSGFNNNHSTFGDDDGEGLWDAAKKLAASAGERLSAAETEVWRRINKQE